MIPLVPLHIDVGHLAQRSVHALDVIEYHPLQRRILVETAATAAVGGRRRDGGGGPAVSCVRPSPEGEHDPVGLVVGQHLQGVRVRCRRDAQVFPPVGQVGVSRPRPVVVVAAERGIVPPSSSTYGRRTMYEARRVPYALGMHRAALSRYSSSTTTSSTDDDYLGRGAVVLLPPGRPPPPDATPPPPAPAGGAAPPPTPSKW
jgi:hypothetical protein